MNKKLFLIFLTSFVLCKASAEVVFPSQNDTVNAASFLPSALSELEEQGTFVLFTDEGFPFGFVQDGEYTDSIKYGNLTVLPQSEAGETIIGGSSMEVAAEEIAKLRLDQGEEFDQELLRQEDFLKYAYYSQRYDGLEEFLKDGMGIDSKSKALDLLNNLEPSMANEFLDMYSALETGQVGYSHFNEIADALSKINHEDLTKYIDEDKLKEINDVIDKIKEEVTRKALDEILENVGEDELELLFNLLKQLDYDTIYQIARDYTRQLARDGTLDKISDVMKESKIGDEIKDQFGDAAKNFVKNKFLDILPKNISYYILAIAVIVVTLSLRRVGG
ncbi:MAG: hypothetical protein GOV01_01160 [Candidatus Altiarchaeota archaeon]|nr:hypothetical protein [Candidatus Altiarchaeota archaeon]